MRVLVVDDDTVSLKLVVSILEKNNLETVPKVSGKEAMNYLQKGEQVDLIISDVMMPGIDGFQLLRFVKTDRRLRRIPVILCTTLNDKRSVIQGRELGVTDYIVKPVDAKVLLSKVQKALEAIPGAILVVDDESLIRNLLSQIIQREGYEVLTTDSAGDALELMESKKVAVVLSDIKMPKMNGLELLATIKKKYPKTPVLLMTGHAGEYPKDDVLAAGADGYITKPFRNTQIAAKIESFFK